VSSESATPETPPAVTRWLLQNFALDVRALAALRIGLALLLLWDWTAHLSLLGPLFTDDGVLSRSARQEMTCDFHVYWWVSLQMLSGTLLWQQTLAGIALVAAGLLLLGYRSKPALVVSYVLLVGLHGRFPSLTQGGDVLLRCLMFWMLFLPLDQKWSLSRRRDELPERGNVVSFGTAAFVLQLLAMYLFTVLLKKSPQWWTELTAAYYALGHAQFTNSFGEWLMQYPRLLQLGTLGSIVLEALVPIALLVPFANSKIRLVLPFVMIAFHASLSAAMTLGTFSWICALYWLAFLPPSFWDRVERWLGSNATRTAGTTAFGSWASSLIIAFLVVYLGLLNIRRLEYGFAEVGTPPLSYLGKALGIDQYWAMFSPKPFPYSRWIRLEGHTADGRVVNLLHPGEPFPERTPAALGSTYPDQYWRRCASAMFELPQPSQQRGYAAYFARLWNESNRGVDRVARVRMMVMMQETPPPGTPREAPPHVTAEPILEFDVAP
jgi:hypothetical protein